MKIDLNTILIIAGIAVFLLFGQSEPEVVIKTEKEIITQHHRDTIYKDVERVKWRTKNIYKNIYHLDSIIDTVILVQAQKEVIVDFVNLDKSKDSIIDYTLKLDTLNKEIIQDLKVDVSKEKKKNKRLGNILKVTLPALGIAILDKLRRL